LLLIGPLFAQHTLFDNGNTFMTIYIDRQQKISLSIDQPNCVQQWIEVDSMVIVEKSLQTAHRKNTRILIKADLLTRMKTMWPVFDLLQKYGFRKYNLWVE